MKKHLILSLGRSGSNHLRNLLNNHPNVTNYGEVLGEWTLPYKLHRYVSLGGRDLESYLDSLYQSKPLFFLAQLFSAGAHVYKGQKINYKSWHQVQSLGVKDFSINFYRRNLLSYLKEREDILILNLYRNNILKRFISLEKMNASGVISIPKSKLGTSGDYATKRIHLDIPYTLMKLELFEKELREHAEMVDEFPTSRVLSICYEDLFSTPDSKAFYSQKIFEFLGVAPIQSDSNHRKILSDNLADIVENYDELAQSLSQTRFAHFLYS